MSYHQKLEQAIAYLGPRWVGHPTRRVERLKEAQVSDLHKADCAATFERVRAALKREGERNGQ